MTSPSIGSQDLCVIILSLSLESDRYRCRPLARALLCTPVATHYLHDSQQQQQHTNQHCNVRDLNYSPALTYLQGVLELGVEQISLQGKWQPCGYGNHFETTVQGALPLPLSSPFLLPLSLSVLFRAVRMAVMMVKGPDWRGHCPAACGQTV